MADKVYQLTFYTFSEKGSRELRELVKNEEFWKVRTPVSTILGVWETQINGLNEYFHIQAFDDVADLLRVRSVELTNPVLQHEASAVINLPFNIFRNALTLLASGSRLTIDFPPSDSAVYELQTMKKNSCSPTLGTKGALVGRFVTLYGSLNTEYRLIRFPDTQSAQATAIERMKKDDEMAAMLESRLLVPMCASALK